MASLFFNSKIAEANVAKLWLGGTLPDASVAEWHIKSKELPFTGTILSDLKEAFSWNPSQYWTAAIYYHDVIAVLSRLLITTQPRFFNLTLKLLLLDKLNDQTENASAILIQEASSKMKSFINALEFVGWACRQWHRRRNLWGVKGYTHPVLSPT